MPWDDAPGDGREFARVVADSLRFAYDSDGSGPVRPGYSTGWRKMPCAVVGMLIHGHAVVEVEDDAPRLMRAGNAVILKAGTLHRITHPVAGLAASSHVRFQVFSSIDVLSLVSVPMLIRGAVARRIATINRGLRALQAPGQELLGEVCARQALGLSLLRLLVDAGTITPRAVESLRGAQRLAEVLAAIDRDLGGMDLTVMARVAGLSPSRLHAVFTRAFACSPMHFVRRLRLQRACELLSATELPIGEVAGRCGFDDQFHFSRAFKLAQGSSPSAYRERMASLRF